MGHIINGTCASGPLVSVIIPVYDVETYLSECLDSVLANTYRNLEVICIDDGSPDACGRILDEYSVKDDRIKVIHQNNRGVSEARNAGISKAAGEFIAFIDSDDYIHPLYFESLMTCMTENSADMVICGCRKVEGGKETPCIGLQDIRFRRLNDIEFFSDYYARHMIWGRVIRRSLVGNIRLSGDVRIAEDTLFNLRVVTEGPEPAVYYSEAQLYCYLIRNDSITHFPATNDNPRFFDFGKWVYAHRDLYDHGNKWTWMIYLQAIKLTLSYRYGIMYDRNSRDMKKEADRILKECLKRILRDKNVSCSQKVIHSVMVMFPNVYRLFRIHDDPSLMDWERKKRIKNRS